MQMLRKNKPKGLKATKLLTAMLGMVVLLTHAAWADTVYRCGETYSTSSRCGDAAATEVKPSSVLHTTGPANTSRDLSEAQALEKQRLQAERQAAQATPMRLNTPSPPPSSAPYDAQLTSKRKGKYARKPNSPYFTAVDPNAAPKKKSTAKAVPAASTSGQ